MSKDLKAWENLRYLLLSYSTMTAPTPLQLLTCQLPSPSVFPPQLCTTRYCAFFFAVFALFLNSFFPSYPTQLLWLVRLYFVLRVSLLHPSSETESESCSIMSNSLPPHGIVHGILQARILEWVAIPFSRDLSNPGIEPRAPVLQEDSLPTESPEKPQNTGVGSLSLLQRIFLTQESNRGLLHCRWILY